MWHGFLFFCDFFKIGNTYKPFLFQTSHLWCNHTAFQSARWSLLGLEWSIGHCRQPGNQQQLGERWCKTLQRRGKKLPPLLPGTSCLQLPLARPSFPLPSLAQPVFVVCRGSPAGVSGVPLTGDAFPLSNKIPLLLRKSSFLSSLHPNLLCPSDLNAYTIPGSGGNTSTPDWTSWRRSTGVKQISCMVVLMHNISFFPHSTFPSVHPLINLHLPQEISLF